jgi:hypothetical protein
MVRVSIEVSGSAHFDVAIQAESIQRAVDLVKGFYSASDVKVVFPIEPESFFVEDRSAPTGIVGLEDRAGVAA